MWGEWRVGWVSNCINLKRTAVGPKVGEWGDGWADWVGGQIGAEAEVLRAADSELLVSWWVGARVTG